MPKINFFFLLPKKTFCAKKRTRGDKLWWKERVAVKWTPKKASSPSKMLLLLVCYKICMSPLLKLHKWSPKWLSVLSFGHFWSNFYVTSISKECAWKMCPIPSPPILISWHNNSQMTPRVQLINLSIPWNGTRFLILSIGCLYFIAMDFNYQWMINVFEFQ